MTDVINSKDVDDEVYSCLDLDNPKSFFLFAGAGSGKTRTLVEVLTRFRQNNIHRLRLYSQQVAIITYTNAACDEIKRRLEFDTAFNVSTIHSFSWELIRHHQNNIREWLRLRIQSDIDELEDAQSKGRAGTKAAEDRPKQIAAKRKRLDALDSIKKFSYNPSGENSSRDSLNHAEVINITADFLINFPLLQSILIRKFPILLVDESQDTKKELIEAFFNVQSLHKKNFSLGLFGDIMQRIYMDGKEDLGLRPLPDDWLMPKKTLNYRCPRRVVRLINKIREHVDNNTQSPTKHSEGIVRLFIADSSKNIDKSVFESSVCQKMAAFTGDRFWLTPPNVDDPKAKNKILTLEHHMAALRGGFSNFFLPLYGINKLKTGLIDGTLSGIVFFSERVLPLIENLNTGNNFAVTRILNKHSPLICKESIKNSPSPKDELAKANESAKRLHHLWKNNSDPTLYEILKEIHQSRLLNIPDSLSVIADRKDKEFIVSEGKYDSDNVVDAWDNALSARFSEFKNYAKYISNNSNFGTHQGIKGLEFPRVMVILDDGDARGFLFSYEKLFGAVPPTPSDIQRQGEGKETSIDRTRRLFYVTCSRAEESLAIIAYTNDPATVKRNAIDYGWFHEDEVIT
ncbi:UvrD-helicase domain-containing protein [Aeromonas veronii]|uniref:UvrD-helicase domain-containing protein n=1 Tax=Aeromonas veronii TaxID=654 RepID=UPI002B2C8D46|nr:DNA helicase [Aeromonas veronii]